MLLTKGAEVLASAPSRFSLVRTLIRNLVADRNP